MKQKLLLTVLALAIVPLWAPFLARTHPLAALWIRSFYSNLCHQDPSRSFLLQGAPVAVCIRCLGIYLGLPLAASLRLGRTAGVRLLSLALLLNLLDVASETLHWHGNLPWPRFALGMLLGLGAGAIFFLPIHRQAEI